MTNKEQIERWFVQYSDDVYKFLVYYTGNFDVEDLVQDVFIKVIKGKTNYDGLCNPRAWLLTIARNTAIDYERKKRLIKWLPQSILELLPTKERTPCERLEFNEEMHKLYKAISNLKRNYREVLVLRGIEGLSVSETAQILDWSESKVKVTLHRALKALEQKMLPIEKGGSVNEAIQ
ncbi:RNA polymerase sigma factor [Ammoniphilus sp. 3BR4]|uniref:RNA polymerase sigma factor n=1 Tax=Ammoniphilus sp. 3BR4 TaxID=3158265 RepID=UPI0034673142